MERQMNTAGFKTLIDAQMKRGETGFPLTYTDDQQGCMIFFFFFKHSTLKTVFSISLTFSENV